MAKKSVTKKKAKKRKTTAAKRAKKGAAKKKAAPKSAKKKAAKKSGRKVSGKKAASKAVAKKKTAKKKSPPRKPAKARKSSASRARTKKAAARPASGAGKKRSALGIRTQHVDFLSYKVEQVQKFYGEVLELDTEIRDHDGLGYLLVKTSTSSTVGFMPPHPDMRGERPIPREPTLYFVVQDVDRAYSQLSGKGVAFMGPPEEMPWGYRVLTTTDPEGRTVMLASRVKGA